MGAAVCQVSLAAPQFPFLTYAVPHAAVVTGNSVPVSVGGYKAVAGSNGDLAGPVHEVPGLVPALATHKQESRGDVSLSTGTGALLRQPLVYYGKREAEADPQLNIGTCTRSEECHAPPGGKVCCWVVTECSDGKGNKKGTIQASSCK